MDSEQAKSLHSQQITSTMGSSPYPALKGRGALLTPWLRAAIRYLMKHMRSQGISVDSLEINAFSNSHGNTFTAFFSDTPSKPGFHRTNGTHTC